MTMALIMLRDCKYVGQVTLHNQALANMDTDPTAGFRKLNFLLQVFTHVQCIIIVSHCGSVFLCVIFYRLVVSHVVLIKADRNVGI